MKKRGEKINRLQLILVSLILIGIIVFIVLNSKNVNLSPEECYDGVDNDNDGLIDFPAEPGCVYQEIGRENAEESFRETSYIISWYEREIVPENTIPFYRLQAAGIENYFSATVDEAIEATNSMPEGHKVIFLHDDLMDINSNPQDVLKNSQGEIQGYTDDSGFTPYADLWWETGTQEVKDQVDLFFREFKARGGKVDLVIMDQEGGHQERGGIELSNFALDANAKKFYGGDACKLAEAQNDLPCDSSNPRWENYKQQAKENAEKYWLAIQNDPRYDEYFQPYLSFTDILTVRYYYNYVRTENETNYLEWNSLMKDWTGDLLTEASYDVIKAYYPNIKTSNYNFYHWSPEIPVPDRHGHKTYLFGDGETVGNTQAPNGLYGQLGQITNPNRLIQGFTYESSPFNAMRYEVNRMRSMKLSSNKEVFPWIAYKSWDQSLLKDSEHYQELIFHLLLTDPNGNLLYWNPNEGHTQQEEEQAQQDDILLGELVSQFDSLASFADKKTLVTKISWWEDDYLLSGMYAGGRNVYRFTPQYSTESTIMESSKGVVFTTENHRIIIPEGKLHNPKSSLSNAGYWIVQPANAPETTIRKIRSFAS